MGKAESELSLNSRWAVTPLSITVTNQEPDLERYGPMTVLLIILDFVDTENTLYQSYAQLCTLYNNTEKLVVAHNANIEID